MGFSKDKFALFYALDLDSQDYANLNASGVKLVMLTLTLAASRPTLLANLASMGVRVVVRVEEEAMYLDGVKERILNDCRRIKQIIPVEAVIMGCEPENHLNLQYGSQDWAGNVWEHRRALDNLRVALQLAGFKAVSPGWTSRAISEDDKPQPGTTTWDEITRIPYNACDGNGYHTYQYGWDGPVDMIRFKTSLREAQRTRHKPIYIDEVGVSGLGPVQRMRAYIEMADLLLHHHLGQRVEMFTPFIAGGDPGNPPAWPVGFLIKEPKAYQELGAWIAIP